ncbi:MAG: Vault protein inter-alpha-trypsin domain protein [Armatimonadetes bacterium]|nr:Vault protein inter-alpha-trypsin domain protein [Armatimonadota bacterium]
MKHVPGFWAVALVGSLLGAPGALAQGIILPRPVRPIPNPQPLAIRSQKVTLKVESGALKAEVEQVFYNPNSVAMEGTYLFPLPESAAVSNFRMLIDKEPVEGKLLGVDEARRVYESYVRRNVDPAILEYVGRNAFQARVFPIPAGAERRIYLVYSQAADFSNGIYRLVYPLNSERVTGGSIGELTVDCSIKSAQPLKTVYSPTHEIQVKRESDHLARVTYEGKDVRSNRDFALYYTTSERAFGLNALAHRRAGADGYAMLMLAPKSEVKAAEIQPKDVVVVFDTSGSMQGPKIEQARKAAQTIIGALNEKDRFNIIRFSGDVSSFRPSVVPASKENREAARTFVEAFRAVGGTGIDDAIQEGLASIPKPEDRPGRSPFLIFMTDGLPTIGNTSVDQILQNAAKAAPKDLRLFSFGVGSDVNTLLLDRLARDNRGDADYVAQDEDLETKIGNFYAKIADPVLSNVKVTLEGAKLLDQYPSKVPDLFAGTQLLILGRYQGAGKVAVTVTGDMNGKPKTFNYDLSLPERELGQDFIPKLWASRRIGSLLEEIRLHGESKELKDEVIRLSQEHGIVTPYTAYLVEEPGLPRPGQPTPLAGTRFRAFGLEDTTLQRENRGTLGGGLGGGGFGGGNAPVAGAPGARPEAAAAKRPASPSDAAKKDLYAYRSTGRKPAAAGQAPSPENKSLDEREAVRFYELQKQSRQQADGFQRSTGANAVEASRRLRALRDQEKAETEVEVSRTVEGRAFRFENGAWKDQTATGKVTVVAVKYGSEAYFKLVGARTEWARFMAQGRRVSFRAGKSTVVVVDEKGKEQLTDAELKALEK